jgi:hypothetical protein
MVITCFRYIPQSRETALCHKALKVVALFSVLRKQPAIGLVLEINEECCIQIKNTYYSLHMLNISSSSSSSSHGSTAQFGPWPPLVGFVTVTFLQGWIVSPAPNPQPGGPGLHIYDPRRQGGPAIPPGTRYPF